MRQLQHTLIAAAITLAGAMLPNRLLAQSATPGAGPFDPKSGRYGSSLSSTPARPADTIAVSAEKAWSALNSVYGQLGISLSVVDTASHVIGVLRGLQHRPVGGERLSRLLECGSGPYGPNAEHYSVQLTLLSNVVPVDGTHALLDTRVSGSASPNGLSSTVTCDSTGRLEELVMEMLKKSLGL